MKQPGQKKQGKARKKSSKKVNLESLPLININAAGIDIGSEEHWVAVPKDRDEEPVRKFGCFTSDLHDMAKWLKKCDIDTVVMESTVSIGFPCSKYLKPRVLMLNWLMPDM